MTYSHAISLSVAPLVNAIWRQAGITLAPNSAVRTDEQRMSRSPTRRQIVTADAPLIGRATELGRILSALDDTVEASRGRLVVLAGEPGVGKTRLARAAPASARALGI